jgi:mRNA interferase MazF
VVARGEVWWHEHPGEERRPYLILQRDAAIPVLNQLIAAPTTRTRRRIPTEVDLDQSDGTPQPCVVTLDNVRLVRQAYLTQRITRLAPERMHQVCVALHAAVDC